MATKTDTDRIFHMVQACREAMGYAEKTTRQELNSNRPLEHSLVRCLEINNW